MVASNCHQCLGRAPLGRVETVERFRACKNFVFWSFRSFVIVFITVENLANDNRKINGKSGRIRKVACLTPLI